MSSASDGGGACRADVLVAGVGPAGSVAALELARAGFAVLVADRLEPGVLKIGETLPGAAIRLLQRLDLASIIGAGDDTGHCHVGGTLTAWATATMVASDALADPYGAGLRLDRARFDAALRQASLDCGTTFHQANVATLERTGDGWSVGLDDGRQIAASWVVDATGRRGRVARLIGASRRRDCALVAVYRYGRPALNAALDRTIIEARPDGWFYAGRLADGRWAFGYHTTPGAAALLRRDPARWEAIVRAAPGLTDLLGHVQFDPGLTLRDARGGGLPSPIGERWVACGDAALCFDPIAGQGLFNALRTGQAAARYVMAAIAADPVSGYAAELAQAAAIYSGRRRSVYALQQRWPDSPFWHLQREGLGM